MKVTWRTCIYNALVYGTIAALFYFVGKLLIKFKRQKSNHDINVEDGAEKKIKELHDKYYNKFKSFTSREELRKTIQNFMED